MEKATKDALENYLDSLQNLESDQIVKKIEKYLDDEAIEIFVSHLEEFYGIEDDEELGMLSQIMVSGYVAAKEIDSN